ncbi:MAG: calcium/sodium antiporter [Candidatus Hydrogenedentes bacterium]|nr:calcium/sodium antiporter [Candidatus Hydrogenedentota bacterium]
MTAGVVLSLAVGLTILTIGAEFLVRGSSKLAAAAGISPLVIGLTIVAYGTSTPELAVSVKSAWAGQPDIALGNVVGSNICNVLLILGVCGMIYPLKVHVQLIRLDVPLMIVTALMVPVLGYNGVLGRVDGAILVAGLVAYNVFIIRKSRQESKRAQEEFAEEYAAPKEINARYFAVNAIVLAAGLVMLVYGARMFVNAAVTLAQSFGVSELVIGLTIVAVGTSLPEVATSIVATIRGDRDIAIGNVVGSNIFNVLSVLGCTALVKPINVSEQAMAFDIPIMIAISVACFPIFFTGMSISRWEGGLFLGYYVVYTAFLVMQSRAEGVPHAFKTSMAYFVVPLTAVTLAVLTWREFKGKRATAR